MKLYELLCGQRFEFDGKHRGKIFEVTEKGPEIISYKDVTTGKSRTTCRIRKTFKEKVTLSGNLRTLILSNEDHARLIELIHLAYQIANEESNFDKRKMINDLYLKVK